MVSFTQRVRYSTLSKIVYKVNYNQFPLETMIEIKNQKEIELSHGEKRGFFCQMKPQLMERKRDKLLAEFDPALIFQRRIIFAVAN